MWNIIAVILVTPVAENARAKTRIYVALTESVYGVGAIDNYTREC